jgi:serine phosphatase RsbU (regulator of sigma subunit)
MTALWAQLHKGVIRTDILLLAVAIVGAFLYVVLTPEEHPDTAASYALGEREARRVAAAFLAESGYAVDGYEAEVRLSRDQDLLHALQASLGRRATRRLLQEEGGRVPAYTWEVAYDVPDDDEDALPSYEVRITSEGVVWDFESGWPRRSDSDRRSLDPGRRADRNAFRTVMTRGPAAPGDEAATPSEAFPIPSDSLLSTSFVFNATDSLWQGDPALLAPFNGNVIASVLTRYQEGSGGALGVTLEPAYAVALARHHLGRTLWDAAAFRTDSVWLAPERADRLAHVQLVRSDLLHGQQVRAVAVVSAGGALVELDVEIETDADEVTIGAEAGTEGIAVRSEQDGGTDATLRVVAEVAQAVLYVVIGLVFIVVFFKRLAARLIDGRAVFLDLGVIALLTALSVGLIKDLNFGEIDSVWVQVLVRLLVVSVAGGFVGLFALMLSGAADSVARSLWSKKLHASSLVRLGSFRNVFVGAALLRGVGLACVLLGLLAGFLFVFRGAALRFENTLFLDDLTWQPMAFQASMSGLIGYLVLTMGLLGVATFVARYRPKAWVVVGAVVVAMAVLQGALIELDPVVYTWGLSALWGLVLGMAFWRYDFLTCFTGFFVAHLIWGVAEGWLVEGSPAVLDVWLAGLFVVGLVVVGVRGVASGETRRAAAEYVPSYITELKQRERLRSELEIAREVQESFLPRTMPNVPGLDIAAMCLAAYEIGGDYYDFIDLGSGKLAVVVGDVSGKGTQAAFYMTLVKGMVQTLSREGLSAADVMRRLNGLFCENVTRGTFISMIYGVFDIEARTFTFARAGHNPVILKRSPSQEPDMVQPAGLAIGLVNGATFDNTIEERTLNLRIGDVLVFYTDGFSEAMNRAKDQYGDDRLARKVGDLGQRSANEILHGIAEDVHHFVEAAGRHDDMTMVVVKLDRSAAYTSDGSDRARAVAKA